MWTVLRSFESEPEARVVEAFLKANQIDVQLLGTHSHSGAVAPGSMKTASMRMMVRQDQAESAQNLLKEAESRAHLSVVTEEGGPPPKVDMRYDRVIVVLIVLVIAVVSYLVWMR
jgi:hypothetical protein